MASPLVDALAQAARRCVAPAAWNVAGAAVAFAVALAAALGALGFIAAGCYLALRDSVPLTATQAAFLTGIGLVVVAGIAALALRRALFGRGAPQPNVADEARRAVDNVQAEAAAAVSARPVASLVAVLVAGMLVGALRSRR